MHTGLHRWKLGTAATFLLATSALIADGTRFSDFTPLTSSGGPTADESAPITLGNPDFHQRSIASRTAQLGSTPASPNTGNWDMNTVNETAVESHNLTGPGASRAVQLFDVRYADEVFIALDADHSAFDAIHARAKPLPERNTSRCEFRLTSTVDIPNLASERSLTLVRSHDGGCDQSQNQGVGLEAVCVKGRQGDDDAGPGAGCTHRRGHDLSALRL